MSEQELYDKIEALKSIIMRKDSKIEELETLNKRLKNDNEHLEVRIKAELEPRIKLEKSSYDKWVTNAER